MHGYVDLIFEADEKYYILDWKTNHLGSDLSDYSPEKLRANVVENKYHLQYMIYTIALKKYLDKKLPDFIYPEHFGGVIYAYVRGMRKNAKTGIYFDKPAEKTIAGFEEMIRR